MSARRSWAWPLVPVYGASLAAKDALRASGVLQQRWLQWPVISVGSLSAGGAGKTPTVIALARLLRARRWSVDVLSRGYGRAGKGVALVNPTQADAARRFGDEPVLIAEKAEVPVWVGASRFAAGERAEQRSQDAAFPQGPSDAAAAGEPEVPLRAHLLDDGFQHRALHRDFDLLVLTEEDLHDTLLPAGNLREPLAALRRADALAVREEELDRVTDQLRRLGKQEAPLWTLRRSLRFPAPLGVFGAGLRPLAFCAIARPESFAAMLTGAGCGLVDTVVFPDHHRYEDSDVLTLIGTARQLHATGFVTTEKDAVKLSPAMRARLAAEIGPLMIVPLEVNFVYEAPVMRALEGRLRATRTKESQVEARAR